MATGMTLEELVSKWTIKTDLTPLEKGREALVGLSIGLGSIAASVGGAAASLFGIAKATANAGEEAKKASQKFGITASAYQELQYAARGEAGELSQGLLFLNKNLAEAAKGAKEPAAAFAKLGVSLYAGGKLRDTDSVLMELTDKFKKMPADARRTAAAVDIFGRSGANLLPFLVQGSAELNELRKEAIDFGYVIQDTEAADNFNDAMDDLINITKGFRNIIGASLIPAITEVMGVMKEWLRANREFVVSKLKEYLSIVVDYVKIMGAFLWNVAKAGNSLIRIFGGWAKVLRVIIALTAAYLALNALYNMGRLAQAAVGVVQGLWAIAKAWYAAGWQAMLAQVKMLAIPIAIGAAIVALLLLIEDLYTFFSGGGETLTADIIEGLKSLGSYLMEFIGYIGKDLFDMFKGWGDAAANAIMNAFKPLVDVLKWIGDKGSELAKGNFAKAFSGFSLFGGSDKANNPPPTLGNVMGLDPSYSSAVGGDISKQIQQASTINQTINIGDSSSAIATGREVAGQTDNVLAKRNREAARTFSAQGDY